MPNEHTKKKTRKEQVHLKRKKKKEPGETTQKAQFQFAVLSNAQECFLYKTKKRSKKGVVKAT